jgi:HEPN domain-containing protein
MKEEIETLVRNWIARAESDLKIAGDEIKTEDPATDAVCFHAQQCVEKYLKAYLIFHQRHFKKTHNIARLIELCKEISQDFDSLYQIEADTLTGYAVDIRYGDEFYFPSIEETESALEIAEKVKSFVSNKLREEGLKL